MDLVPNQDNVLLVQSRTFGSHHPGGGHFARADGSVHFVAEQIEMSAYRQLAIRADGLPIGGAP